MEPELRVKLLAGMGLVCVSTSVGVLYKASQAATGGFRYSTASAICMAELVKLGMSSAFHVLDASHHRDGVSNVRTAVRVARDQVSVHAVKQIGILSFLYMFNNQLSFFIYTLADPGTIFMFKSASTAIVALVQRIFVRKTFTRGQWRALFIQASGMFIVQYDPCKRKGIYPPTAYLCMAFSALITAVSTARNEYIVKNYSIGLNVQNMLLYLSGVGWNLGGFFLLPVLGDSRAVGFFEGYDNPLAIGIIVANSCMGLAINAVYKYADAVVKCFASDVSAVVLNIISMMVFGLESNITRWCGVCIVSFAVHLYIQATNAASSFDAGPTQKEVPSDESDHRPRPSAEQEPAGTQELSTLIGRSAATAT